MIYLIFIMSILFSLSLWGCKNRNTSEEFTAAEANSSLTYAQVYNYLLSNNGLVKSSAKKQASKLTFNFIQAGVQTDAYGQYIRLFFHADDDRDYIEAVRCDISRKKNTCLFDKDLQDGNRHTLAEIEKILNSKQDFSHLTTSTQLNNCWNELTDGCAVIGEASTAGDDDIIAVHKISAADNFIDLTAPINKEVYYIARVCINADRNDERESSNRSCSPTFRSTNTVTLAYDNQRNKQKDTVIAELGEISAKLDYMTQRGHELSIKIVEGLDLCAKRRRKHEHEKNVRDSIATLAGIGVGIGASISVFGWKDIHSMGAGADAGKALGAAFADVVRSVNDYPRSTCPEADPAIAEITKLMGFKEAIAEVGTDNNGYLYNDLISQYQEKLAEYQKVNTDYMSWFENACYIANIKQQQKAEGACI